MEFNNRNEVKMTSEKLIEKLKEDLDETYSVALHSINSDLFKSRYNDFVIDINLNGDNATPQKIIDSILKYGINVGNKRHFHFLMSPNKHLNLLGNVKNLEKEKILEDWFDREEYVNVLVATPNFITINNNEFFIGSIGRSSNLMSHFCCEYISPFFIYGYYIKNKDDEVIFVPNEKHISKLSKEEQNYFFNKLITKYFGDAETFERFYNNEKIAEDELFDRGFYIPSEKLEATLKEKKYYDLFKNNTLTNKLLLEYILNDVGNNYQIGLHEVMKDNFENIKNKHNVKITIPKEYTVEDLVDSAMKNGLNVPDGSLYSTVFGFGNIGEVNGDIFNHYFFGGGDKFPYQLIILIPTTFKVDNNEYFAGKLVTEIRTTKLDPNLLVEFMFNKKLPSCFIYGYYIKQDGENDNELYFVRNDKHISKLSDEEKEEIYRKIIEESDVTLELLQAVLDNSDNWTKYKDDKRYIENTKNEMNKPNGDNPIKYIKRKKQQI